MLAFQFLEDEGEIGSPFVDAGTALQTRRAGKRFESRVSPETLECIVTKNAGPIAKAEPERSFDPAQGRVALAAATVELRDLVGHAGSRLGENRVRALGRRQPADL